MGNACGKGVRGSAALAVRPPEERGMHLSDICAFRDQHYDWLAKEEYNTYAEKPLMKTMYDVVPKLIVPATIERKVSYNELGPARPVDYFVSHWWGEEFVKFIKVLWLGDFGHFKIRVAKTIVANAG